MSHSQLHALVQAPISSQPQETLRVDEKKPQFHNASDEVHFSYALALIFVAPCAVGTGGGQDKKASTAYA